MSSTLTQPSITFKGFKLLKVINENNTTPQRLKWLWEKLSTQDYAFDDFTRGQVDFFLSSFTDEQTEVFELGDAGLIFVHSVNPKSNCDLHYIVWDTNFDLAHKRAPAVELFDYLFYGKGVHRVNGFIPSFNQRAVRFAIAVGFKYEGENREAFLYHDKYHSILNYGMLEKDYRERRERLL